MGRGREERRREEREVEALEERERSRVGGASLKGAFAPAFSPIATGCLCPRERAKMCLDTNKHGGNLGDYIFNRPEVLILFGLSPCY